jgi:lysophospholipase L1-like esterase
MRPSSSSPPVFPAVRYRLGGLLPGATARRTQVAAFAAEWRSDNESALHRSGPLWVALGDSATQGIGASSRDTGYVLQVLSELRRRDATWQVVNLSRTGARVADVLADQLPALAAVSGDRRPTLVTVAIGMNDLRHRTRALPDALRHLLDRLPSGAVVATMPRGLHERRARQLGRFLTAEAARRALSIADLWAHTGPPWKGKFSADLFHPNDLGYQDWTAAFLAPLRSRGLVEPTG